MSKFTDWFFEKGASETPLAPDADILEMEEVETIDAIPTSADPLWVTQERVERLERSLDATITLLAEVTMGGLDNFERRITHLERMAGVPEGGT